MISIKSFTGIMPVMTNTTLPNDAAQEAVDCDFTGGVLTGLQQNTVTSGAGSTAGLSGFIYSDGDTKRTYSLPYPGSFARSPAQQDDHKRIYWTGKNGSATEFRFMRASDNTAGGTPAVSYKVGVAEFAYKSITLDGSIGVDGSANSTDAAKVAACIGGFRIGNRTPPIDYSDIQVGGEGTKLVIVDAQTGAEVEDVSGDIVSALPVGVAIKGWHANWDVKLANNFDYYTKIAAAGIGYTVLMESLSISGTPIHGAPARAYFRDVSGAQVARYAILEGNTQIGRDETTIDGEGGSRTIFVPMATGTHVNIIGREGGVTAAYFVGYTADGRAMFSTDNTMPPATVQNSALTTGDTFGTEGFTMKVLARIPMTRDGVRYEASVTLGEWSSNIWDPALGINVLLNPLAGSNDTLRLAYSFGDIGAPGDGVAYIATFVNQLAEESAPLPPVEIWIPNGASAAQLYLNTSRMSTKATAVSGGRYPIHGLRLYRTAVGTTATTDGFFYVGTYKINGADLPGETYLNGTAYIDGPSVVVTDAVPGTALGTPCDTLDFIVDVAELQKLQGLTTLYNGMLAAFKDNEVWYCEPYKPWAWKRSNVHTLPHKVVALLPQEQGVYILTEQYPFYASGATPDSMVPTRIPAQYPCLSADAATITNGRAMYLSPDGPVLLDGGSAKIENFVWSREAWREKLLQYSPTAKPKLVTYGHRAIIYFQNSPSLGGLIFDTADNAWSYFTGTVEHAFQVPVGTFGNYADELACKVPGQATWSLFGGSAGTRNFVWRSKDFVLGKHVNFSVVQLFGKGRVRLDVFSDDRGGNMPTNPSYTRSVDLSPWGTIVRLPGGFLAAQWSFRLTGETSGTEVTTMNVAIGMKELQGV